MSHQHHTRREPPKMMRSPHPKSPSQVLGVPHNATVDDIRASYKKQALRCIKSRDHFIQVNGAYRALMRDRASHSGHDEKGSRSQLAPGNSDMPAPRKIAFPVHVTASSSGSSTRTTDSFDSPSRSTAPSSPPQSMHSNLDDNNDGPYSKLPSFHSTDTTIDEGSAESLLEDWVSVEDPAQRHHKPTEWEEKTPHAERNRPASSARYAPRHVNQSHTHLHDYPISTKGTGTSKVWRYSLAMTLEDLFHGRDYRFRITRFYLSGMKENVMIDVHVPAGSVHGTVISCLDVGHQRRDGSFQDILFIVQELSHNTYVRIGQDLVIKVQIPWTDDLRKKDGMVVFNGIDNRMLSARISYAQERHLVGQYRVREGGMPIWRAGRVVARGDVIVQWEIQTPPSSRWTSLKSWLRK